MYSTRRLLVLSTVLLALATMPAASLGKRRSKHNARLPAACLRDATALCHGASTNTLRCLSKLVKAGDIRVSHACSSTLPSVMQATKQGGAAAAASADANRRAANLRSLLAESGDSGGSGATGDIISTANCPQDINGGTIVTIAHVLFVGKTTSIGCGDVCCKYKENGPNACCVQSSGNVFCQDCLP